LASISQKTKNIVSFFFMAIVFLLIILTVANLILKIKVKKLQVAPYVYKAEELAAIARQNDGNIKIIVNDKKGIWDRKKRGEASLILQLKIGGKEEKNPNKQFYRPGHIKLDNFGYIYIAEELDGEIKKFDKYGNYISSIGKKGQGPGEIGYGFNFLIDNENTIHVIDRINNRIMRFSCEGKYLHSFKLNKSLTYFPSSFVLRDNNYYISYYDRKNGKVVHIFDYQGNYIGSFADGVKISPLDARFDIIIKDISPGYLNINNDTLLFSRRNPYEIHCYDLRGHLLKKIFRKNSFMQPHSVKLLPNGGVNYSFQAETVFIGIWKDYIINQILIPPYQDNSGCIVDIYNKKGILLTTIRIKEYIVFSCLDNDGFLYGVRNLFGIPEIIKYKLVFGMPG